MSKCVNSIIGTEGMVGLETVATNPKASDMTMRDHFAGLAMQRLLDTRFINIVGALAIAKESYEVADAMMEERLK